MKIITFLDDRTIKSVYCKINRRRYPRTGPYGKRPKKGTADEHRSFIK